MLRVLIVIGQNRQISVFVWPNQPGTRFICGYLLLMLGIYDTMQVGISSARGKLVLNPKLLRGSLRFRLIMSRLSCNQQVAGLRKQ